MSAPTFPFFFYFFFSVHDCQLFSFWTIDIGLLLHSSSLFASIYIKVFIREMNRRVGRRLDAHQCQIAPAHVIYITVPIQRSLLKKQYCRQWPTRPAIPSEPHISLSLYFFYSTFHWQQLAETAFLYSIFFLSLSLSFRRYYYSLLFNLSPFFRYFPLSFSGFIAVLHYTKVAQSVGVASIWLDVIAFPLWPLLWCVRVCVHAPCSPVLCVFFFAAPSSLV